jgi:predicted helicase
MYRPFCRRWTYYDAIVTHRLYQQDQIFPVQGEWSNRAIAYTQPGSQKDFMVCAVDALPDLHFVGAAAGAECPPQFRYEEGQRLDNITDWSLKQFTTHYKAGPGKRLPEPTKEGIFHYVYAVLHDPAYREAYAQNLKRDFPRVPLHGATRADFWCWADWGRALMDLHIGYEAAKPWALRRSDTPDTKASVARQSPKSVLKADPAAGRIVIDSETVLDGVPPEAWAYRLGNRCAVDWVLDQHKEKKPKDPTIRAQFDTYRLVDHKDRVIDLLARVVTVSVETRRIVEAMQAGPR